MLLAMTLFGFLPGRASYNIYENPDADPAERDIFFRQDLPYVHRSSWLESTWIDDLYFIRRFQFKDSVHEYTWVARCISIEDQSQDRTGAYLGVGIWLRQSSLEGSKLKKLLDGLFEGVNSRIRSPLPYGFNLRSKVEEIINLRFSSAILGAFVDKLVQYRDYKGISYAWGSHYIGLVDVGNFGDDTVDVSIQKALNLAQYDENYSYFGEIYILQNNSLISVAKRMPNSIFISRDWHPPENWHQGKSATTVIYTQDAKEPEKPNDANPNVLADSSLLRFSSSQDNRVSNIQAIRYSAAPVVQNEKVDMYQKVSGDSADIEEDDEMTQSQIDSLRNEFKDSIADEVSRYVSQNKIDEKIENYFIKHKSTESKPRIMKIINGNLMVALLSVMVSVLSSIATIHVVRVLNDGSSEKQMVGAVDVGRINPGGPNNSKDEIQESPDYAQKLDEYSKRSASEVLEMQKKSDFQKLTADKQKISYLEVQQRMTFIEICKDIVKSERDFAGKDAANAAIEAACEPKAP